MSLLERLCAPSASELGRKRKIDANPAPPKGNKHLTQNLRKFDPKSVRPSQRVKEFPVEELSEPSVFSLFVFSDFCVFFFAKNFLKSNICINWRINLHH